MLPLLRIFFNPSVQRTPPLYFALQNTGEEGNTFLCIVFVLLPLLLGDTPNTTGHGREEVQNTIPIVSHQSIAVLKEGG